MQNEKIGILTLYYKNRNYGGLLQAYALQKFLAQEGLECEQISFDFTRNYNRFLKGFLNNPPTEKAKQIYRYIRYKKNSLIKIALSLPYRKKVQKRIEAFDSFQNQIPHSDRVYLVENIMESLESYHKYICGSDVIWNAGIPPEVSCLGFVKDRLKIAYAPSIGIADPPSWWLEAYGPYLKRLDAISVREDSVREGIEKAFPKLSIESVLDPVFLLTDNFWIEFAVNIEETKSNSLDTIADGYVFCYLLGSSMKQREEITKLAKKWNKKIVTFPFAEDHMFRKCDKDFGDCKQYGAGPKEFLRLLCDADVVITDSFHATAFSMIFHRPFWVVDRKLQENSTGMNGRAINLLLDVHLQERYCEDVNITKLPLEALPDYQEFDMKFSLKRKASRRYLLENLTKGNIEKA